MNSFSSWISFYSNCTVSKKFTQIGVRIQMFFDRSSFQQLCGANAVRRRRGADGEKNKKYMFQNVRVLLFRQKWTHKNANKGHRLKNGMSFYTKLQTRFTRLKCVCFRKNDNLKFNISRIYLIMCCPLMSAAAPSAKAKQYFFRKKDRNKIKFIIRE